MSAVSNVSSSCLGIGKLRFGCGVLAPLEVRVEHTNELEAVTNGGLRWNQVSTVASSDHLFPLGHCEKSSLHLFKPK